ncbi:MAG TPA: sigma-70 family RNA polymerase sigma factor [Pyrinomonadaceae bacterium]|nr:sigma-70 family RNA polymerase sigma factor [Pyrinomonadaceae bacterium]
MAEFRAMPEMSPQEVTQLLADWGKGDRSALDRLFPLVHSELRRIAQRQMNQERAGHTLQATALVNEAYLKLVGQQASPWQNRAHFFAVCAQVMRHILIDHARAHRRDKRGGGAIQVSLNDVAILAEDQSSTVLALDEALRQLETLDPQKGKIVELRYFGGLSIEETAEVLNISPRTVRREWQRSKVWLYRMISEGIENETRPLAKSR